MAAPKFAPVSPVEPVRWYGSPDHAPAPWTPDRPAEITGFQPEGARLGYQGPDQGFAIKIANTFRPRFHVGVGEHADDAVAGCLGIALRRASMFSRAPVVHDLTIAFTIWGWLVADPPADLVDARRELFAGLGEGTHHYADIRHLADLVPESTLRMTPQQVAAAFPQRWRELVGLELR